MKCAMILVAALACVSQTSALAEPVGVSLEWSELDCTNSPELAERFQQVGIAERQDPRFADLEKAVSKRMLVRHVQWIEPGTRTRHSTQIGACTLNLDLAIRPTAATSYEVELNASLDQLRGRDAVPKPERLLTASQMRMATRLAISTGQSWAIGGLRSKDGGQTTIQVLIVAIEDPNEAKMWAGGRPSE